MHIGIEVKYFALLVVYIYIYRQLPLTDKTVFFRDYDLDIHAIRRLATALS